MKKFLLLLSAGWLLCLGACNKDEAFTTDKSAKLAFTTDTLRFDTVFTSVGSAVRYFKIVNPNNRPIKVSRIYLEAGAASKFRLNVDGIPGKEFKDVEIYANDSVYVFAQVTINPNAPLSISPFVVEEKVMFETNGNVQEVHLEAWGQNANYYPSRFNKGVPVLLSCRNTEINWNDPRPYVIYGVLFIDSCLVNIPAGTRIYVHGGIAKNQLFGTYNDGMIYLLRNGRLRVQGTKEKPVIIQGDRLETTFKEKDGQWAGIVIGRSSKGSTFDYTTVKNSIFGIYADSSADITLRNTRLYNTSSSGLIGVHSKITADNCLIYNNSGNSVQIAHGGDYTFNYCTIASYGVRASALGLSNYRCYDDAQSCQKRGIYRLNALFRNSIIFGSDKDELEFGDISGGQTAGLFNIKFENCIVKVADLLTESNNLYKNFIGEQCNPCINAAFKDKLFKDPNNDNYRLDTLSVANGMAKPLISPRLINIDLEGILRDAVKPDIGSYERKN